MKNKIYPCIWLDNQAREAAEFYGSTFGESKIIDTSDLVVRFSLSGQTFMLLNGGPQFQINPSISFYVLSEDPSETERLWYLLIEGGSSLMPLDKYSWSEKYGWLQDKYGVNWQLSTAKMEEMGQKFTPALMFVGDNNGNAEQAIKRYISIFKDSRIKLIDRYNKGGNEIEDNIRHAQFYLNEKLFIAMDSSYSHAFNFNEAISFVVECDTQKEIDYYWGRLTAGGEESQCGWLKDAYGVSWQIVPSVLKNLLSEPMKAKRVTDAFLKMKKLDIQALLDA